MSVAESTEYRSPVRKLLPFFRSSRDKWKAKCQAAKKENKTVRKIGAAPTGASCTLRASGGRLVAALAGGAEGPVLPEGG